MKRISNIVALLLCITIVAFITSCEKGPQYEKFSYPAQKTTGISAQSGYPGTYLTITGSNFDTLPQAVKVWFGGVLADSVISSNGTQIVVKVPAQAVTGKVSLQVWTTLEDSIGYYTVLPAPVIKSVSSSSKFGTNIALPGDTVTFRGTGFGTDGSKISIDFNGTPAPKILSPVEDSIFQVVAPEDFSTGNLHFRMNGLTIIANPAIINPTSSGDITPYFMANTGDTAKGGGFKNDLYDGSRWGTLAAPWVENSAAFNKSGGTIGGWSKDGSGVICWETWSNTPVINGIIYQPTTMPLPAGDYTVTFKYYSEIQQNSTVYLEVAAGDKGIPILADISTAMASVKLSNPAVVGTTAPNVTETKSVNFTVTTSQVVSIGFLGNLTWGNGSANPGNYFTVQWIKLIKN